MTYINQTGWLSPTTCQPDLLLDKQLAPALPKSNIGIFAPVKARHDAELIRQALACVTGKYDALRPEFDRRVSEPWQRILERLPVELIEHDFSDHRAPQKRTIHWIQSDIDQLFDVGRTPMPPSLA